MPRHNTLNLLPIPRSVKRRPGVCLLPKDDDTNPERNFQYLQTDAAPPHPEGYALTIRPAGVTIDYRDLPGRRNALATVRQLRRAHGRHLPCLKIRDWPDFARRGVMLDVSRGRVPKLETLLEFAEQLAGLKINELQLYTEHTFAYRRYRSVWQSWGALTAREMRILDARCRELGIDLVPNQNSFGHLRYFLADPRLKKLGELSAPYEAETKDFLRRPTTLAPNHPGTLPFLRGLYDELLPNFSSRYFNVGCDETWDLGKGQSRKLCARKGQGLVYFDFLRQIHREVARRGKCLMVWGDIILKHPALIPKLATLGAPAGRTVPAKSTPVPGAAEAPNLIALNWGYEANHPFAKEAAQFARAGVPFYVCPGTSTWQTLLGRHDNALANLRTAAKAGQKFGALGYLNTDWGDGGHPQPLTVSWPLFAAGAALAWNARALDEHALAVVLNRDIFRDASNTVAQAALALGLAHQKLGVKAVNETPLGTVIAAPKPADRELFCRNGLQWYAKIPAAKIRATLAEIGKQRAVLGQARSAGLRPGAPQTRMAILELDLAARMAAQSCQFMLWQQALAAGNPRLAGVLAKQGLRELQRLEKDFKAYWPRRNKATPRHCSPFLRWRMEDYASRQT